MKKNDSRVMQGANTTPAASTPLAAVIKRYRWLITWCLLHLGAMLLSYRGVPFFNNSGEPKTEKFWPFVKFTNTYFIPDNNSNYSKFNGLFTEYDWTEFSFYTGVVIFAMVLIYVNRKTA
jgi:hypothetical protein